jgi:hypothetical protein
MNDLIINDRLSGQQISSTVKEFISEHNQICTQPWGYNKFWKKLFFSFVFTMIPMNLCLLYEILFQEFEIYVQNFVCIHFNYANNNYIFVSVVDGITF